MERRCRFQHLEKNLLAVTSERWSHLSNFVVATNVGPAFHPCSQNRPTEESMDGLRPGACKAATGPACAGQSRAVTAQSPRRRRGQTAGSVVSVQVDLARMNWVDFKLEIQCHPSRPGLGQTSALIQVHDQSRRTPGPARAHDCGRADSDHKIR